MTVYGKNRIRDINNEIIELNISNQANLPNVAQTINQQQYYYSNKTALEHCLL